MKTIEVIKTIIGGTYTFRSEQFHIKDIKHEKEDRWLVYSDKKNMIVSSYQLKNDFTSYIAKKGEKSTALVISGNKSMEKGEVQYFQSLTEILMDNIKKVQTTPTYIHQAKSVNESIKNIIELKKTQIEVVKLVKGK